ncbi:MAG TPA: ABC transporter permease [Candidatus Polarisedimenticolia bacterium]|nr:ABC transporter permease [Candidatus Polarisedimenticolia bacterium]
MRLSALRRSPAALAGALIVASVTFLAALTIEYGGVSAGDPGARPRSLLARHLLAYGPHDEDLSVGSPPAPASARHWLGTDVQRRDLLSRVLHGAGVSLRIGLSAEAIALSLGLAIGGVAALRGGWVDALLMRAADLMLALPLPILAMAAIAVFDTRSVTLVFVVLGLMGWAGIARLVRTQCLAARFQGYPEAARALGAGQGRLLAWHLLPAALAPALVAASMGVAANILTEAWLSFLGLGLQGQAVSWGTMIADAQPELAIRPRLCLAPGAALAVTVLGFVLLADGLRDLLDPRARLATHAT